MNKLVTKDDVYELLSAPTASAALGAAIETGLLWLLADKPMDAPGVSQALGVPGKRCHYWLQILHSIGILDQDGRGFVPSSEAYAAILNTHSQASWSHLALDERERAAGVHNLALYIREPGSVWKAQGLTEPKDYVEKNRIDPERARDFTRMLYELHQNLAKELPARLDMTGVHRLLDVGGGLGVVSMALLRKYPHLTCTVVDLENVCIAGREIAEENSLADRITYLPADFYQDEFPGGFDMVIKCDVSVFGEAWFRKLWGCLLPGGRLVLADHLSQAENMPPRLEWSFLDSLEDPNFSIPTVDQVQDQLVRAGFRSVSDPCVLPDRRILIQAQK